jgi:hypothetical protein
MKFVLVFMLLAASAFAQNQTAVVPPACGPKDPNFDVKLDKSQHTIAPPEPGKARVYFIQDLGKVNCIGACGRTKIGLDGTWVGAVQHNSYFSVSVEPGEHHLCAAPGPITAFAHLTAEAGKTYYFRTRGFSTSTQLLFDFDPIDSDQAKYLIASFPLSVTRLETENATASPR